MPFAPAVARTERRSDRRRIDRSLDRSVALNQLLFGVIMLLVLAIQQLFNPDSGQPGGFFAGLAITFVGCGFAVAMPWRLLPRILIAILPVADIVAIALVRSAQPALGAGLLWVFPVIWLSSYFGIVGSIVGVGSVWALIALNIALAADPVSAITISSVVILPILLAFVAASSQIAARRSLARRTLLRAQSRVLEAAMIRARREENLLADVLDAVDFAVARVDASGVTAMNDAQTRLARLGGAALAGTGPGLYESDGSTPVPPEQSPVARARRGEEFTGDVVWVGPPSQGFAISVSSRRLRVAPGVEGDAVVMVSRDTTSELQAVRARDDLMASVSHELRTPLTSIVGFLDLAVDEEMTDRARRHLDVAERNASRLLGLITDILSASSGKGPAEFTIDRGGARIDEIVRASVESLQPKAVEAGVALTVDDAPATTAHADAFRIRQVVDNLLSNAIKYNRPGGAVRVELADTGTDVVIRVHDTGQGVSPEELPRLFERYFRSESVRGSTVHGSGLGLPISRDIMRGHGGDLVIDSTLGVGSVAEARLPKHPPSGGGEERA